MLVSEIKDMVTGTLDVFWKKPRYTQIAQKFQRYPFYGNLLQENRLSFDRGLGITHTLMDKLSDTAEWVGLFEGGTVKFTDLLTQLSVDYKHLRNHWPFDVKEKWFQNGTDVKVAGVLEARDEGSTIGLIEQLEDTAWKTPDSTLTKEMFPVAFWIVFNTTTEGFTGKYPSGFTALAGVDLDKHPNFQNFSRIWVDATPDDLLKEMRLTHMKTDFTSPLDVNQFRGIIGQDFRIYTSDEGMLEFWGLSDKRKEGPDPAWDIGAQDNQKTFKGNAMVYTPALDSNPVSTLTHPYYFINKGSFHVVILEQDFMRRAEPMNDRNDPDTFVNWKFLTVQTMCTNRRANGIVAKVA